MRDETLWTLLRVVLAGLIAAHGWARLLAGGVAPFGVWLESQGMPMGTALAWGVTLFEIVGSLCLVLRRWVFPVTLGFAAIYLVGLVLVHMPAGWFVVGLGRNGMEYSVLLVVALLCIGFHDRNVVRPG